MRACHYCGAENEDAAMHCRACGTEQLPVKKPAAIPAPKLVDPAALAGTFSFENGFHRADWQQISGWIESNVRSENIQEAWTEAALIWMNRLRDDLGGDYFILRSAQTALLCDQPLETAQWVLAYAGRATTTITQNLGETAWHGAHKMDVLLIFSDEDDYYQYLSHHMRDGEQAASGGACVHSGYTHVAMPWHDPLEAANTIVHELSHDCLAHLPLPHWLDEGVAVTLQKAIAPTPRALGESENNSFASAIIDWRPPTMWDELAERHFAYWTEDNLQSFWAGTSFYEPGDPNELSYSLAEVFLKLLTERADRPALHAFLQAARQDDAGQTAAMDILSVDLGEIAGTFLGEGNWRPQRKAMIQCWETSGWKMNPSDTNDS